MTQADMDKLTKAAAPDLLKALERFYVECLGVHVPSESAMNQARQAMAKAKGQE